APINVVRPKVAVAQRGRGRLVARHGVWNGAASFTYQWLRCDRTGRRCRTIGKATLATYTIARADVRSLLTVAVTARNAGGSVTAVAVPVVARSRVGMVRVP